MNAGVIGGAWSRSGASSSRSWNRRPTANAGSFELRIKMKKKLVALLTAPIIALTIAGCGSGSSESSDGVDVSRVRVVLGSSSTTADTYQNAHAFTTNVEDKLGASMKADAVGANNAFQALE